MNVAASNIGANARAYHADITSHEQVKDCIALIRHDLGPIEVLLNNAGVHMGYGGGDQAAGDPPPPSALLLESRRLHAAATTVRANAR